MDLKPDRGRLGTMVIKMDEDLTFSESEGRGWGKKLKNPG